MFASKKTIPARAADALDLMIEFVTLGEYGLEYPQGTFPQTPANVHSTAPAPCEKRTHVLRPATTPARGGRRDRRRDRPDGGKPRTNSGNDQAGCRDSRRAEPMDYRAALRTPRVRLSFSD
jgi:hypothetical protein